LPDAVSSDRERLLSKALAEPCIELRKLLQISRMRCPRLHHKRCREKNARSYSRFPAEAFAFTWNSPEKVIATLAEGNALGSYVRVRFVL